MKALTLVLTAALATGAILAPRPVAAAGVEKLKRLALVDLQRVILETKEGQRSKKELESTFARGQARLDRKAKALQKRLADLQAKASMLSQAELQKRGAELQQGQAELEQLGMELQQDVMEKEAMLTEQIYTRAADVVEQIALEEKLQVVFIRSEMTVLWSKPQFDITNRVIIRYDKKHK